MSDTGPLVYVVDDDVSAREGVAGLIRSAGFRARTFGSGEEFLAAPRPQAPGCLVLDVNLPGVSGLDLQRELTTSGIEVPIIFLTGHGDIPMTVRALKAGAVNFLTKPFEDEQLLSAIRQCIGTATAAGVRSGAGDHVRHTTAARRTDSASGTKVFPPFRLDPVNQCLWRLGEAGHDERVTLTPKAFAVLRYLVEHAGRLITLEELLDAVWPETFVQPEVLKYQIADIRGILGDRAKNPIFIETLPRRGYRFIAPVRDGQTADLPASVNTARATLVGRARELNELQDCFAKALKGDRQFVFITGEAGIGKTALIGEFQRWAAAAEPSLRIARGQCVEGYGGSEPYYPMLEALGQLCRGPNGHRVAEILAAQAPTWLVQFPSLLNREQRQVLQQEILGTTRDRMLREAREALDALRTEGPILWLFEDMQWADPSTVDLISVTARRPATANAMVILTKRPDGVAPGHPLRSLKSELLTHRLCREITLGPLSESDMADYLRGESAGSLPDGFAELIYRRTEGNPLFMMAALDHMAEHGLIASDNGTLRLKVPVQEIDVEVPETLRHMIEAHIEHLTMEEQRVLEAASVAGTRFSALAVTAALQQDVESVEEILASLLRRSLIVRSVNSRQAPDASTVQAFEFIHTFYREVFHGRLTPMRRTWIRERIEDRVSRPLHVVAKSAANHLAQASASAGPTLDTEGRSIGTAATAFA